MSKATTKFVEFNEEVLPKVIPAVIDSIWYPKPDPNEDESGDDVNPDDQNS